MGCGACVNVCPNDCIKIVEDSMGFYVPEVNEDQCIGCNKCSEVCPAANDIDYEEFQRIAYYGRYERDNMLIKSSSGGFFTAIADYVVKKNGVVFGAVYDVENKSAYHTDTRVVGLDRMRKSKYVQSDTRDTFAQVKTLLKDKVLVLYTGTPCQIHGLLLFLNSFDIDTSSLITIDLLCGGVPPNRFLKEYMLYLENRNSKKIFSIDFRPKTKGWRNLSLRVQFEGGRVYDRMWYADMYYNAFLNKLSIKRVCGNCKYGERHPADITLGDFWNIRKYKPDEDDDRGLSIVHINTLKGDKFFCQVKASLECKNLNWEDAKYCLKKKFMINIEDKNLFENLVLDKGYLYAAYIFLIKHLIKKVYAKFLKVFHLTSKNE